MSTPEYVWLHEERMFAELVFLGAYYSQVRYTREGIDYEVLVSNDEFDYVEGDNDGDDDPEN